MIHSTIFYFLELLISCSALFLHTIGLLGIYYCEKKSNQNLILCSLSVSETIALVTWIITLTFSEAIVQRLVNTFILITLISACLYIAHYQLLLVMIILTADRLVCAVNPLRYKHRVTRKRLKKILAVSWVVSLSI